MKNQTVGDRRQQFRAEQIRERINLRMEEAPAQAASGSKPIGEIRRGPDLGNVLRLAAQQIEQAGDLDFATQSLVDLIRAQAVAHEHDRLLAERDELVTVCRVALACLDDRIDGCTSSRSEETASLALRDAVPCAAGQEGKV
jgi:hypothetical protein